MRRIVITALAVAAVTSGCGNGDSTAEPATTSPAPATSAPATSEAPDETTTTKEAPEGTRVEVTVKNGKISGPGTVDVSLGEQIVLVVDADVSDEVHVHAIDIHKNVTPGKPVTLRFTADIPGQFEVELESTHTKLVEFHVR